MDPAAGQRVQVEWQGGNERLAFASTHLGDLALVQDKPADQLYIVRALANGPFGGLAHHCESFGKELIERGLLDLAAFVILLNALDFIGQTLTELVSFVAQGLIAESFELRFQRIDLFHSVGGLFDFRVYWGHPRRL